MLGGLPLPKKYTETDHVKRKKSLAVQSTNSSLINVKLLIGSAKFLCE